MWVTEKGDSCDPFTEDDAGRTPGSKIVVVENQPLVLGLLENSAVRSDNQHVGAPGSSSRCAVALIVY